MRIFFLTGEYIVSKKRSEFDKRMKKYEYVSRTYLTTRTPVIIRIDGKCFHSFTRGFKKPFDEILSGTMQETMKYLCENIQGCVLGYTQSDEITLILVDYKEINTCAWFDYNIQKCASIAASMATMAFNRLFKQINDDWWFGLTDKWVKSGMTKNTFISDSDIELYNQHCLAIHQKDAMFDARAFNIPKEEVCNNILWRQQDATRNSIQMVGHANFSDKQMHGKNTSQIQDMLMLEKGINWNDFPTKYKRGSCCVRKVNEQTGRSEWVIDNEIPIFKAEGRKYIDNLIYIDN
jgi:tRNA(His) 5'-end guanylyltransferase